MHEISSFGKDDKMMVEAFGGVRGGIVAGFVAVLVCEPRQGKPGQ